MAVESDFEIVAHALTDVAERLVSLTTEVESRRASERESNAAANSTYWLNYLSVQLGMVTKALEQFEETTSRVLISPGGQRVFG